MTPAEALRNLIANNERDRTGHVDALREALAIVTRAAGGPCVQCAEALAPRPPGSTARCCACAFDGYKAGRRRALNELKTWLENGGPGLPAEEPLNQPLDVVDAVIQRIGDTLENIK